VTAPRHQPSGAQNRRAARERAKALAAAGQYELKLLVRAADCEPLLLTGDLSEDDLTTGGRLSVALTELLPDMVRYPAERLEEEHPRALSLHALTLPGSRTALGEATPADLELARQEIDRQTFELACWRRWLELIAQALPPGKTVREALDLEQFRALQNIGRRRA
jgi:hypothetical protein